MVLQALTRYYDILAADPNCPIARLGYSTANVSFALLLSPEGELQSILPLFQKETWGKKEVEVPRRMIVPEQVKRSGTNPTPNFLCDGCAFVLGISKRDADDPSYSQKRFNGFRELNLRLLGRADCPEARAVTAFLTNSDPQRTRQNPLIVEKLDGLLAGGSIVFKVEGSPGFAHEAPQIQRVWEAYKAENGSEALGQCLVTGEWTRISRLHPSLKGVRGAQMAGATLVGFNAPAYESYNRAKGQGWNAPTGEKAVFAYTTVLNYLLSHECDTPKITIGDTTVVYWAESINPTYTEVFTALFDPQAVQPESAGQRRDQTASLRIYEIAQKVKSGAPIDIDAMLDGLDKNVPFYVLGLAPNAARVSVRFFYSDPFLKVIRRILSHYQDMAIQRQFDSQPARISLAKVLDETVSQKASERTPAPLLAGAVMRSILNGAPYPASLFNAVIVRIRADADDPKTHFQKINYIRAAVIKAYLTRKYRIQPYSPIQEVLCMALNEESTHPAYLLGRLFAVLEKAQADAIGDVNASIKDRYFTTACANPASVFPVLLRLAQHHINKAKYGWSLDKQIEQILGLLQMDQNPIPRHLSLDDQGVFVLGYYHQRSDLYTAKNANNSVENQASTTANFSGEPQ